MLITEILIQNITLAPFYSYLSGTQVLLNIALYGMIALLLYGITGRINLASGLTLLVGLFWGNLNFYVIRFRGRIVFPSDILSIKTALSVKSEYTWSVSGTQIALLVAAAAVAGLLILTRQKKARRPRPGVTVSLFAAAGVFLFAFFGTGMLETLNIKPSLWVTQRNGVLLNFMVNLKFSQVEKPDGYGQDVIDQMSGNPYAAAAAAPEQAAPNIIVVMNESFSDPAVFDSLQLKQDALPFLNSLKNNTIRGYAYSSVRGGNTANSEYEFLTGNSMAFLPVGSVAYQLYVEEGDYNLARQLKTLGYSTIGMHPYGRAGWNRFAVYPNYGFDEALFLNDYQNRKNIRNYVSDNSNYEELIRVFEERKSADPDNPLFIFNVTMQNHGGYGMGQQMPGAFLSDEMSDLYPFASLYMYLINRSDYAFQRLLSYFAESEEPTIILMFGDHQPMLEPEFYETLFNTPDTEFTLEQQQLLHKVPFYLWANFDIPQRDGIETSLNFLSPLLLDTAGLPLTDYQAFLADLQKEIPVINSLGFREAGGDFVVEADSLSKSAQQVLQQYQHYQYNGVFDSGNRARAFFYLQEQKHD